MWRETNVLYIISAKSHFVTSVSVLQIYWFCCEITSDGNKQRKKKKLCNLEMDYSLYSHFSGRHTHLSPSLSPTPLQFVLFDTCGLRVNDTLTRKQRLRAFRATWRIFVSECLTKETSIEPSLFILLSFTDVSFRSKPFIKSLIRRRHLVSCL